jgi:hypothetical protein
MASRDYTKHFVSTSAPSSSTLGDEWYNPSTNKLYKRLAIGGTKVVWQEVPATNTGDTSGLQPTLVNGMNIKTVNSNTLLGSGDLTLFSGGLVNIAKVTALPGTPDANTLYIVTG